MKLVKSSSPPTPRLRNRVSDFGNTYFRFSNDIGSDRFGHCRRIIGNGSLARIYHIIGNVNWARNGLKNIGRFDERVCNINLLTKIS
jgi:hypothetical protein